MRRPNNQGKHLHQLQTMTQNHLMSQKDLLEDLETIMEYQQKHEKIPFIGNLNHSNSLEHSYQTEDGEHLILNIILKKTIAKRLTKEHYLKELVYSLGDLGY